MTAVANSDDLMYGVVPCAKFVAGMQPTFDNITVTKGVPVRAVKKISSGFADITDDAGTIIAIYSLQGVKIFTETDISDLPALAHGIYIIRYSNGKIRKIQI